MIRFSDIQGAFFFVSSAGYGMNSAVLCKDTGKILYRSEMGDVDVVRVWSQHLRFLGRQRISLKSNSVVKC